MRKRAGSGWTGGKKKTEINRRDKDTMQKGKGSGCPASIRQSPPAFAEAQESDRLETDHRIWRIVS
jgi:hypothetical protein